MKPNISEFSYGYALTEGLIRWVNAPITAAPVFPSLIEEGRPGGGYDLKLDFSGLPLFVQFKLSNYMKSRKAIEFEQGLFGASFYRMYLRPLRHSNQHELLLDLENAGNEVYYAAPAFHEAAELNDAYVNQEVMTRSVFIRPSEIGTLPDRDEHYVAFQLTGDAYRLSKNSVPVQVLTSEILGKHLSVEFRQKGPYTDDSFVYLSQIMIGIVKERFRSHDLTNLDFDIIFNLRPIQRVAYLSRMFFGCEMFTIREKQQK
ncbi:MAG: hypothetical protein HZC38_00180 [Chloroflexi bacterium]|nr:hypothetical protein [Chloroflexota bacterium]